MARVKGATLRTVPGLAKPAQRALTQAGLTRLEQLTKVTEVEVGGGFTASGHGLVGKYVKRLRRTACHSRSPRKPQSSSTVKHTCHAGGMRRDIKGKPIKAHPGAPTRRSNRPRDVNQLAHLSVKQPTEGPEEPSRSEVSRVMAALGRKGGKIGGVKRAAALSKAERIAIAQEAAQKRWSKRQPAS
jgi:hypothetical protein